MDVQAAVRALAQLTGGLRPSGGSTVSQFRSVRELVAHCLLLDQAELLFPPNEPLALAELDELDSDELATIREIWGVSTIFDKSYAKDGQQLLLA